MPLETSHPKPADAGCFEPTRWSLVLKAGGDATNAHTALEQLCTSYWYPLYVFVRRQGHGAHDAQDLTQGFFARLLEKFCLTGERGAAYSEIAQRLGTTEGALKVAIHRLRDRYRMLLRAEIANTVGSAADVDDELRHLFSALSM